jgi:transcriptional regulator with XRE-family HTH domain
MAGMPEMLEVGARVRTVRKRLGLHRRQVAHSAGLSTREFASLERGRRQPTIDEVRSIAGSLGVEVDEFVSGVDQPLPADLRIDDILDELPAVEPLPVNEIPSAPSRERRKAPRAEAKLERSFAKVRAQLGDVARCCDQVGSAAADDDIGPLLDELEGALTELRTNPAFSVAVERHHEAIATYETAVDVADAASWRSRADQRAGTTPAATNSSTTEVAPA